MLEPSWKLTTASGLAQPTTASAILMLLIWFLALSWSSCSQCSSRFSTSSLSGSCGSGYRQMTSPLCRPLSKFSHFYAQVSCIRAVVLRQTGLSLSLSSAHKWLNTFWLTQYSRPTGLLAVERKFTDNIFWLCRRNRWLRDMAFCMEDMHSATGKLQTWSGSWQSPLCRFLSRSSHWDLYRLFLER